MSMGTCNICDRSSTLFICEICKVKCCQLCLNSHQTTCEVMHDHHYHMCQVHHDQQLDRYCQQCSELICTNCRYVGHKDHVLLPIKTAFDNCRKVMSKVGQDLDMKCVQLKKDMEILKKQPLLSQQKTGTSIQATNEHLLELLQEAKTNFDFLKKESYPLTFLSKWSYIQQALIKYRQLQRTATETPQSHEQMTLHVPDDSKTSRSLVTHVDGTHVNTPPKCDNSEEVDEVTDMLASGLTIDDNPDSTSSLPSSDAMEGDFVNITNKPDTRESNDNRCRSVPDKREVVKLQKGMERALVEGQQKIKQWQKDTEENEDLRCSIDQYKEQIADMSKQLGLHKQEKDHILVMATAMVPWIADINERKNISNSHKLNRPEHMSVDSFVDNMELILNRVTDMKNEMLTTEGNLAAKLVDIAKWMDEQRQTEEGLNQEINEKAKTIDAQDKELQIGLSRIKEINAASDALKNENNKLRQHIHDNQKKAVQQQRNQLQKLEVENDGLRRSLIQMNTELQQRAAIIESLQRTLQDLTYQINKKDEQIRDVKREKDDLRTRLSSLAGDKLTKGNPAITDLGDPNRPMKLAEKYGELYDNEWTDAMDCAEVKALYPDMKTAEIEEIIIRHLYQLVTCCYRECLALSKEQLEEVGNTIVNALKLNNEEHDRDIPGCKEVSKFRRQCAAEYADYLFKQKVIVEKIVFSDWEYVHKSNELVGLLTETPFFEKCVNLCWHMAIQDPVMHLDKELPPDTAYDKTVYREFVKSGDKVTFVVWPALFLHEGGPLLSKGVVQAYC